jgi:hypothetical protein
MCDTDPPAEEDLERQKQLEADAVQNGIARLGPEPRLAVMSPPGPGRPGARSYAGAMGSERNRHRFLIP